MYSLNLKRPNKLLGFFYFLLMLSILTILITLFLIPIYKKTVAENLLLRSYSNTLDSKKNNVSIQMFDSAIEADLIKDGNDARLIVKLPVLDKNISIDTILVENKDLQDLYLGVVQSDNNILENENSSSVMQMLEIAPQTKELMKKLLIDHKYIHITSANNGEHKILDLNNEVSKLSTFFNAINNSMEFASIDNVGDKSIMNFGLDRERMKLELSSVDDYILFKQNILQILDVSSIDLEKNIIIFVVNNQTQSIESITVNIPTETVDMLFSNMAVNTFFNQNVNNNKLTKLVQVDFININNGLTIDQQNNIIDFAEIEQAYKQEIYPIFGELIKQFESEHNFKILINE